MKHACWTIVAVTALAGCASATPPEPAPTATVVAAADGASGPMASKTICRTEKVVGSNRPLRICRSADQRTREREHSRDFRDRMSEGRPEAPPPPGGG